MDPRDAFRTLVTVIMTLLITAMFSCNVLPVNNYTLPHKVSPQVNKMYKATVPLYLLKSEGYDPVASAVILHWDPNQPILILTASHVPNTAMRLNKNLFVKEQGRYIEVGLLKKDDTKDLATMISLINAETDKEEVELPRKLPMIGEDVWVIGAPYNHPNNVTRGVLSSVFKKNNTVIYRTDAVIFYGNSGGGLFNTLGKLIGIISRVEMYQNNPFSKTIIPGGNLATGLPSIVKFLKETK